MRDYEILYCKGQFLNIVIWIIFDLHALIESEREVCWNALSILVKFCIWMNWDILKKRENNNMIFKQINNSIKWKRINFMNQSIQIHMADFG